MISETTLRLLNSTALTAMSNVMTIEMNRLIRRQANARSRLVRLTGQHQQVNRNLNRRLFVSPNSGIKSEQQSRNSLASVSTSVDTMLMLLNSGNDVFKSGAPASESLSTDITNAKAELDKLFPAPAGIRDAFGSNKIRRVYSSYLRLNEEANMLNFQLDTIHVILRDRATGVAEEPKLNYNALFSEHLSQQQSDVIESYATLVENSVMKPYRRNKAYRDSIGAQLRDADETVKPRSKFDLVYGPPISMDGKFILSEDGLYYDSRGGGIPNSELLPIASHTWNLDFAPYLGGRGKAVDTTDFSLITNTVFSDDFAPDDPNGYIDRLLEIDEVLQAYYRDRNTHINQVESEINSLIDSGFTSGSPTVLGFKRSQAANGDAYEEKIKKRKKQIQLFALFGNIEITEKEHRLGPDIIVKTLTAPERRHLLATNGYKVDGSDIPFDVNNDIVKVFGDIIVDLAGDDGVIRIRKKLPRVPLNDFSYLKGSGLLPEIKHQERITISEDVQSIISAEEPIFVKGNPFLDTMYLKDFNVDEISRGDFVKAESGVSGTGAYVKALGDSIVTTGLEVCYNFLTPDVVKPSSKEYLLDNFTEGSTQLNGKLVASSTEHVFPSGLSIPFLRGTIYNPEDRYGIYYRPIDTQDRNNNNGGAYVRIPNNIKDGELYPPGDRMNGLTYSEKGWSLDFWTHIPEVSSGLTGHHRYRIVAACENSGKGAEKGQKITSDIAHDDEEKVRGLLIGFRDKDVSGLADHTAEEENYESSSTGELEFVVLPTVGQNSLVGEQVGWEWGHSIAIQEKDIKDSSDGTVLVAPSRHGNVTSGTELGMKVSVTTETSDGKSCSSCDVEFSHYNVSFNYLNDKVTVFLDGKVLATSSISTAFNIPAHRPLNTPTAVSKDPNSYRSWHATDDKAEDIKEGMSDMPLSPIFTPWILGGGYSDMINKDARFNTTPLGFLGANTNDQYKQHVGSTLQVDRYGGVYGQHLPALGGQASSSSSRKIPRSGLDGFLGSVKFYSKPLNTKEVTKNYNAQQGYFKNIQTYRS